MKKLYTLLAFWLVCVAGLAKPIDEQTAKAVAQTFLAARAEMRMNASAAPELAYKVNNPRYKTNGQPAAFFYVFNQGATGYVIIAGDDEVTPVLGYSTESNFNPNNIPNNLAKWLEAYKKEIAYVLENNLQADAEIEQQWQALTAGQAMAARQTQNVNPLVQTKWNQAPNENGLCPGGSVTGCVATAMAQIMKYWNYPATGSGFHSYNHQSYGTLSANYGSTTYDWNAMPNVLTSPNSAVATLMYHVGVSVDMNYSPQVSGAWVIENSPTPQANSEYALKTYFGYKNTLQGIERDNYSQAQWISTLKAELDASRPILYAGFGTGGGHAFVCDGYDTGDFFHFNWGWGGNSDGYFQVHALNPGSLGAGGGSGGYNSGQQVVIGIEPATTGGGGGGGGGGAVFNLSLYNYVMPSASTIYYGEAFSVATNIANNGTNTFSGDYGAAIFDAAGNFTDFVQVLTGYSLQGGYAYTSNLIFSTTGLFSMLPGTYYVGIFYKPPGGNWQLVTNSGAYSNFVPISVINPSNIELNSAMTVSPSTTLTQGQPASVTLNLINAGFSTFTGQYGVGLYNLDGSLAQVIGTVNETNGLPPGYTYLAPYLTFSTSTVTVGPGTYLLAAQHNSAGWQLTGSTYFQNPITVTVVAAPLAPDQYEPNNQATQAYTLPVNFSGNSASMNTSGTNCHTTSDADFFKIELQPGYEYTLNPRLHDSYNSGNGNTYTLDGLFSISSDGVNWVGPFDDVLQSAVLFTGGGTVYFQIVPYFPGETGSYLLDLNLSRSPVNGLEATTQASLVRIFPNPASDFVTLDFTSLNTPVTHLAVVNALGQQVGTEIPVSTQTLNYSVRDLAQGLYYLRFRTADGVLTRKLVVGQ